MNRDFHYVFVFRELWKGRFIFRETWSRPSLYHPHVTVSCWKLLDNSWDGNGHNGNNTLPLYLHFPVGFPRCYLTVQQSEAFFALISVSSYWRAPPYLMWGGVWVTLYSHRLSQVEDLQDLSVRCVPEDLKEKIGNIRNVGFTEKDSHRCICISDIECLIDLMFEEEYILNYSRIKQQNEH